VAVAAVHTDLDSVISIIPHRTVARTSSEGTGDRRRAAPQPGRQSPENGTAGAFRRSEMIDAGESPLHQRFLLGHKTITARVGLLTVTAQSADAVHGGYSIGYSLWSVLLRTS